MRLTLPYLLVLALGACLLLSVACTPYPEGPRISFQSALNKISSSWQVREASLNGVDITAEYDGEFYSFDEDGDFQRLEKTFQITIPPFSQDTILPIVGQGEWAFVNNNEEVEWLYDFTYRDPYNSDVRYTEQFNERWRIDRLADGELWLRNDSMTLRMEFFTD